jgi:hypothetical protein
MKESLADEIESYKPQKSIAPSHHSMTRSKPFNLEPSKPIRTEKEVGPIARKKNKKTIFDEDTTYNQYDYSKPEKKTVYGKNRGSGYNPLNTRISKNQPPYMKSYVTESALPPSGRTPIDPYENVYNYSHVKNKDPRVQNSRISGQNTNLPPKKIPFKNFVENMASRNSVGKNNIRNPTQNGQDNSRITNLFNKRY